MSAVKRPETLRDIPRVVWVLGVGRFFSAASSFLMLFLTLYLTGPRHLAIPVAGLVVGAVGVGMLLGNFTGGRWGDRYGHRRTLMWCGTIAGLAVSVVPWLPTWLGIVLLPTASYLNATASVSAGALSALAVPPSERRTSVAIGRAFSNAGFIVGPPIGALVIAHSWDAVFVVDGMMNLAVRFFTGPMLRDQHQPRADEDSPRTTMWQALRADRSLAMLLPAIVLVDIVYRQLYSTVPLRLRDAGEPIGLYTALIAIGSALIVILEIPIALRLRRRSSHSIVVVGYGLVGLGFLCFGLPVSVLTAVTAMVVLTAGEILYKTTAQAHFANAAPEHLVGHYQGLYVGAATSGSILAAPLGTLVLVHAPDLLWPLCCAATFTAGIIVHRSGAGTARTSMTRRAGASTTTGD